jgi:hypothetical protein
MGEQWSKMEADFRRKGVFDIQTIPGFLFAINIEHDKNRILFKKFCLALVSEKGCLIYQFLI